MIKRNPNMQLLSSSYLFPEIGKRKREFLSQHPNVTLHPLGVGDTTEPLPPSVTSSLKEAAALMGCIEGYIGYGPEQGIEELRKEIAHTLYQNAVDPSEVFVSDGAKCDIGRLQVLFGGDIAIAVQDPAYPVYVDGSLIQGVKRIVYLPCLPENQFFPDLTPAKDVDILYFCNPNNPTGAACTRAQLEELVAFAKNHSILLLFDTAYASYITDPSLPKSIYEIEGAKDIAIEIGSFSKLAGFTGIRLGWTVVPEALKYQNGHSIRSDWNRITTTLFNGASILSQKGALACLTKEGLKEVSSVIDYYLTNASLLKQCFSSLGYSVYGGDNAPYLWVHFPKQSSWQVFQRLMEEAHVITTPGEGFGSSGKEFIRLSAYGKRDSILLAIEKLKKALASPIAQDIQKTSIPLVK